MSAEPITEQAQTGRQYDYHVGHRLVHWQRVHAEAERAHDALWPAHEAERLRWEQDRLGLQEQHRQERTQEVLRRLETTDWPALTPEQRRKRFMVVR